MKYEDCRVLVVFEFCFIVECQCRTLIRHFPCELMGMPLIPIFLAFLSISGASALCFAAKGGFQSGDQLLFFRVA